MMGLARCQYNILWEVWKIEAQQILDFTFREVMITTSQKPTTVRAAICDSTGRCDLMAPSGYSDYQHCSSRISGGGKTHRICA
jgi:hypothetical protein